MKVPEEVRGVDPECAASVDVKCDDADIQEDLKTEADSCQLIAEVAEKIRAEDGPGKDGCDSLIQR